MIKYDFNLTIEKIAKMKELNEEIMNTYDEIISLYKSLDKNIWRTNQKDELDNILFPFFEESKKNLNNKLNDYIEMFNFANKSYQEFYEEVGRMVN